MEPPKETLTPLYQVCAHKPWAMEVHPAAHFKKKKLVLMSLLRLSLPSFSHAANTFAMWLCQAVCFSSARCAS